MSRKILWGYRYIENQKEVLETLFQDTDEGLLRKLRDILKIHIDLQHYESLLDTEKKKDEITYEKYLEMLKKILKGVRRVGYQIHSSKN